MIFSSLISKQKREEVIDAVLFSVYAKQEQPKKIKCVYISDFRCIFPLSRIAFSSPALYLLLLSTLL